MATMTGATLAQGTADNMLAFAGNYIFDPIKGFLFTGENFKILAVIGGISILLWGFLSMIRAIRNGGRTAARSVGIPISDFDAIKGRALMVGSRHKRDVDNMPLSSFDRKEYKRSRSDKASNYGL